MTVLVIDDDDLLCESLRLAFEDRYRVICASSGKAGLDLLASESISIVLLDYKLEDMDGIKILTAIRQKYRIPVIMMTGFGDKELVLSCWQHKADHYFDKPFDIEELNGKINALTRGDLPFDIIGLDRGSLSPDVQKAVELIVFRISAFCRVRELCLEEISSLTAVTSSHLSRMIKKECGMSFQEIVSLTKVEVAARLIKDGRHSIKEISFMLGFNHPNNFSRFFKKMTGRFPSAPKIMT